MIDTSLLIDHFRKTNKANSRLVKLSKEYSPLYISAVTEFEILSGATSEQDAYWSALLSEFKILPFNSTTVRVAVQIKNGLKRNRKSTDIADLFIAATALANNLPFDTLNRKHFQDIPDLTLLEG